MLHLKTETYLNIMVTLDMPHYLLSEIVSGDHEDTCLLYVGNLCRIK